MRQPTLAAHIRSPNLRDFNTNCARQSICLHESMETNRLDMLSSHIDSSVAVFRVGHSITVSNRRQNWVTEALECRWPGLLDN